MKKEIKYYKIAGLLIIMLSIYNFILAFYSGFLMPITDTSEFAAMGTFARGIADLLTMIFSLLSFLVAIFLLRKKRKAYIWTIVLLVISYPVTAIYQIEGLFSVNITEFIFYIKTILPFIILGLLIMSWKEFRKS